MHHKRRSRRADSKHNIGWRATCSERKLPIEDGPCNGGPHSKRRKPPKDKCPANRVHEWYKENVELEEWAYRYWWERDYARPYKVKRLYHIETCIHCWKEKKTRVYSRWEYRHRKLVLPKRKVKLY